MASPAARHVPIIGVWTRERASAAVRAVGASTRRFLLSDLFSIFLATRLAFLMLTYFGQALFHDPALVGQGRTGFSGYLLDSWFYRDSQWFQTIVAGGYHYFGPGVRSTVAFFPVYPAVIKSLSALTSLDSAVAAMVISNAAFLGAMVYLQKLCRREYGEAVSRRAVLYMAIFPTAFFSFAPYSESLFLMLSIASLYYMRSERWWVAGVMGGFAAGTRILGVLLVIPFAIEYARVHRHEIQRLHAAAAAVVLIPAGLAAYMLYLYGLTGDAFAFVRAEGGWNRVTMWPWQVLVTSLQDIPKAGDYHPYFQAHALVENGLLLLCIATLLAGLRYVPISFTLYGFACVATLLSAPVITSTIPITSMSRYLFVIVPVYITIARLGRWPIFDRLYVLLSGGALAIFTALFLNHMWGA